MEVAALVALAVVLVVGASILWSTLRTGMPPMPSLGRAPKAMLELAPERPDGTIVDMGSGWGTLAIRFARRFPQTPVVGYEVSFFPWLVSVLLARLLRLENLHFHRRDFREADLDGVEVLLCYLMPGGMQAVQQRLERDPGSVRWVISHCFALRGREPETVSELPDLYATRVYRYRYQ
ncbi:MAG: methyltransferase [Pseudomonadota bacterium]